MEYSLGQFVWTVLPVLVACRLVACCHQSPECDQATGNTLRTAIQQSNRTAVCSILPVYVKCLEDALTKCQQESPQELTERSRSSGTNITDLQSMLENMKLKYKESCNARTYDSQNSSRGGNDGIHNHWVVSLAALIIFTCVNHVV